MLFSMSGTPVYAVDVETGASAVCPHHVHDETCGYSEGTPCTHEHTDDCYTLVTECVHEHTAECYPAETEDGAESGSEDTATPSDADVKEASACTHVCSVESGCITKELNCQHVHDETCGYSEGSPCTFDPADCEICNPTDSGEPEAPAECTCETLCTADSVDPDCPVCGAEGADLADCTGAAPALLAKIAQLSKLVVGGTTVVENSQTTENTSGQGWSYDVDSNTLTLNEATINGTNTTGHVGAGIYAEGDLTIVLEGSSTVTGVQDPNGESQSIRVSGNLTIQGGGSLTAQGAETSSGSSYGIFVTESFTQQSGSVTAIGGDVSGSYNSEGLYVYGSTVTVQGGTLTATGGTTGSGSYGISANGSVTVSDATVTATGGTGNSSYGLYVSSASHSVTVSGSGSLTARSGSATKTAGGIYLDITWGSTGSVTVGNGSTLLTNSVIFRDSSFNENPLAPTGDGSWLIYGQSGQTSAVGGNYTLEENLTIENGNTFTIPAGSTLTVPQGKTLTVNGTLNIANQSSLTGSGSLAGSGAFNLTNPDPVISGSETLTYDGTDQFDEFKLEAPSGTEEVMGQAFNISSSASISDWSLETQEIINAGTYTLTAKHTDGRTIQKQVTVNKATSSISINDTYNPGKTYDGTALANPTESELSITGAGYDDVTFTWYEGTSPSGIQLGSAPTDAGTYYLVASIPDSNNTTASEATSGEITITKATATAAPGAMSVSNKLEKVYTYDLSQMLPALDGGKTLGEVSYALGTVSLGSYYTNGATISGSTLTLPIEAVDSSAEKEIGTVTVTISSGNYADMTGTITVSSVNKLPQTVTISGHPGSVVYGDSFTLSASAPGSGAVSWSASGCASVDSNGKVTITGTGEFTITAAVAEDETYTAASNGVTMTAGKKTLTITADSKSAYVGDSAPALTYTVTGLVGSDTLTTAPTLSYAGTPDMSKAGEVQILISGAEAGDNYDIQYVNGTLTVTPRPTYLVTVNGGTGGGSYEAGQTVTVTATVPEGMVFTGWTGDVTFADPAALSTTFSMPAQAVTVTANWTQNSGSGGGSSSGSGSSSSGNKTETTTNSDGSTTTTVTKPDGTVTETTKWSDGSQEVVETKKDGTVTTTTTDTAGNQTQVVENPDGSSKTTVDNKDGSGSVTLVDENGRVVSEATLSQSAVAAAQEKGEAAALPMPEVPITTDRETAPTITVDLPSGTSAKVEIPVENVTPGTVAVIVKADGTEEVIKTSLTTENGVAVTLSDGDTVKVVDNSKTFDDVSDNYWGAEAVAFASSRELFAGTSATTFAPETAMTRAMIVTVLARFEGVDTTTGSTWYEAGRQWAMQNGVSDGTNMDQGLTREQLATMLYRYAQSKGYDTTQGGMAVREYADFKQISDYAVEAMTWAVNTGLISGTSTTTLSPQGLATRAQVATILMRFIEGMA